MTSEHQEPPHQLLRDGTSRGTRDQAALAPNSVALDDRSLADLLVWSASYAQRLAYFDKDDRLDGNWRPFWENDISLSIAEIDAKRPLTPGAPFQEIDGYRKREAAARASGARDVRLARFRELCNQLISIPRQFETWKNRVEPGLGLRRQLEETIESTLKPAVRQLMAYDAGAQYVEQIGEPLGLSYQGLDTLWQLPTPEPDRSLFQGLRLDDVLDYAIQRLSFIFERVQRSYVRLVNSAEAWLEQSLQHWPRHNPHFALFLSFLQLFRHAQRHLNGITERQLDFFYERVLQISRKPLEPDHAHVVFELATHVPRQPLEAGTRFSAGKDASGIDVQYQLEEPLVVNRGRVSELRALYVDALAGNEGWLGFHVSPVANSTDGVGAPLDETKPRWKTFGKSLARPRAPVGFALASPMFFLAEGQRVITVTLVLERTDDPTLLKDLFASTEPDTRKLLPLALTTANGWYVVPIEQMEIDATEAPRELQNEKATQNETQAPATKTPGAPPTEADYLPAIRIRITLGPEDPPIARLADDELGTLDEEWPALKLETSGAIPKGLYHRLSTAALRRIDLVVSVEGIRELALQNDLGRIKPGNPFHPFGPVPKRGSAFYVGCWEAFQKTLDEVTVRLDWVEVPARLNERYAGYPARVQADQAWAEVTAMVAQADAALEAATTEAERTAARALREAADAAADALAKRQLFRDNRYFRAQMSLLDSSSPRNWTPLETPSGWGTESEEFTLFLSKGETDIISGNLFIKRGTDENRRGTQQKSAGLLRLAQASQLASRGQARVQSGAWYDQLGRGQVGQGRAEIQIGSADVFRGWGVIAGGLFGWFFGGWRLFFLGWYFINRGQGRIRAGQALVRNGYNNMAHGSRLTRDGNRDLYNAGILQTEGEKLVTVGEALIAIGLENIQQGEALVAAGKAALDDETDAAPGLEVTPTLPVYARMPKLRRFSELELRLPRGFLRIETLTSFFHEDFPKVFANAAIAKSRDPEASLPEPPYTPTLNAVTLSYRARESIDTQEPPAQTVERFYHLHPFGREQCWPVAASDEPHTCTVLPRYDVTQYVDEEVACKPYGALYVGVEGLSLPQNLSLLFQVVEGSADPQAQQPEVKWGYLAEGGWQAFDDRQLLAERTNGLIGSGIVAVALPETASTRRLELPQGKVWLRAEVNEFLEGVCDLAAVYAQAARVKFVDRGNAPGRLSEALPAGSIEKQVEKQASIKSVAQPFASFGGREVEAKHGYYRRVSERLRHKDRAVTIWDFERLVLEHFPSVYKVKCLSHTDARPGHAYSEHSPGAVCVVVIANLHNHSAVDHLAPRASLGKLAEIQRFLRQRVSPFVADRLHVMNPLFEQIHTQVRVQFRPGQDIGLRRESLDADLKRFLSPWAFKQQTEIEFGGSIHASAMVDFIDEREYVDSVLDFNMSVTRQAGAAPIAVQEAIASSARSILVSAQSHDII